MTTDAVTGATSYTGRFIAERLVAAGRSVLDLTRSPRVPHPLGEAASSAPLDFDHPDRLAHALDGVDTLYNTFWIRFERGVITHQWAIERSRILFAAAQRAPRRRSRTPSSALASRTPSCARRSRSAPATSF